MSKVVVVGLGYVGLPVALAADKSGHEVTGFDLDEKKIKKITNKKDPLSDEYVEELIANTKMTATSNPECIKEAQVVVVAVPTPVKNNYQPNLDPLKGACLTVLKNLSKSALVIIESTINPGVCDEILIPYIQDNTGKVVNKDYYIAHCPERINPGDKTWNVENIPRVLGASNKKGLAIAKEFYESFVSAPIKPMGSIKEAEACKVVENSFRDVNIAFVNELAKSFTKLGINVKNVIDGAATKPFAFMPHYPSVGVGGHCIPVDPYYLIEYARDYGFDHEFLSLARSINNSMPAFTVDQLVDGLNEAGMSLKGARVLVLGLSYKSNVADDRESPSYKVINILKDKGAKVSSYDPFFKKKSTANSLSEATSNQDAIVLATSHEEFLTFDYAKLPQLKVIIDGKNVLTKPAEVIYRGIGV